MIKHAYILEARGHPGHDVIRNFYQSQGLKDGKLYNKQGRCVGDDQMVTRMVQNHEGQEIEQKGWQGGDGENTVNLKQIIQATYATMVSKFLILRGEGHKFTPGVATMWARGEFGQNFDSGNVNAFNESLNLLVKFHFKDYDKFLRNIANGDTDTPSADEIIDRFSQSRSENIQGVKDRINAKEYTNTKYFIKPITEYDDLLKYRDFCYPKDIWCLMDGKAAWDSYTSNGIYQFYLVLDKRLCDESGNPILENKDIIPVEEGENHPNDEYGLSMIGIIVDSTGELAYCTTRWNHTGSGSDHTMDAEQISDTLGVNFYQTFKPNHKFQDALNKAINTYHETGSLDGFDKYYESDIEGLMIVHLLKKKNILNIQTGELLSNIWFDYIESFYNDLAIVSIKGKYNFINTYGQPISNTWFDYVNSFYNDLAIVRIKGKYNFINRNGQPINDTWFDYIGDFINNFRKVKIDKKYNFINIDAKLISNKWFDGVYDFYNDFAIVESNKKFNIINTYGKLISNTWFDDIKNFRNDFAIVYLNNKCNFINTDGQPISDIWFDYVNSFYGDFAIVKLKDKYNFINTDGQLISNTWFDLVYDFYNGIALVKLNNKYNFINTYGQPISDIWFDYVENFYGDFGAVKLKNKWNFINRNGKLISDIWFDYVYGFSNGKSKVDINDMGIKNIFFVDENGNIYDKNNKLINKKLLSKLDNYKIANESLKYKNIKFLNEVIDLNRRIKKLYE